MKKYRIISLFLSLTLILQMLCVNLDIKNVKAANSDITNVLDNFITGINITDKDGNPITTGIDKSDNIRITYNWHIKDGDNIEKGDYYIINLPKEIKIKDNAMADVNDQYNNKIADLYVFKDKTLKVVFTDYVEDNKDIAGEIFFECGFDEKEIVGDGEEVIEFEVGGESKDIVIEFKKPTIIPTVEKSGVYNSDDGTITWTIVVNKEKGKIKAGAEVKDKIFKDNLKTHEYVDGSATIDGKINDPGFSYDGEFLCYKFQNDSEEEHVITFKTKVEFNNANSAIVVVKNRADFYNDGVLKQHYIELRIVSGDINKTAVYDGTTGSIVWYITVNEYNKVLKNVVVKDIVPDKLEFDNTSVQIDDGSGFIPAPEYLNGSNIGYNYNASNKEFEYHFGDINKKHVIRFLTKVKDSDNVSNSGSVIFRNKADMYIDGSGTPVESTGSVEVKNSIIDKRAGAINSSTGEIEWIVYINKNRANLTDVVFKDEISQGQKFVEGSFSIKNIDNNSWSMDNSQKIYDNNTLEYKFGNIDETYVIKFKTAITNYDNSIFSNTGTIESNEANGYSTASATITKSTIKKTAGEYDHINKEITWKIMINEVGNNLTDVIVEDEIPNGQEYVQGSFTISPKVKGKLEHEPASGNVLEKVKYTFEEPISSAYVIEFKTKITDLSIFDSDGKAMIKNKASLKAFEIPNEVSSEAEKEIIKEEIKKGFNYTQGRDIIDWFVTVNMSDLPVKNATIEDKLQDGLILETDTVKLHELVLDGNGKYVLGKEIVLSPNNVDYDKSTNIFKLTFPGEIVGPLKLSFSTKVTKEGKYKNEVLFKGDQIIKTSETEITEVLYNKLGGWGTIYDGSIKIVKVDGNNPNIKLSGAVFQLLDKYNNVLETSSPTGSDGVAEFKNLKYNVEYKVVELTPPSGYTKSNEVYEFILRNNSIERNIEYTFKNYKNPVGPPPTSNEYGEIILKKIDESGNSLENVEFTLYDLNGRTIQIVKSDKNGVIKFTNLPYGKYIIKETKGLSGYELLENDISAEVNSSIKIYDVGKVENKKIPEKPPVTPDDNGKIIVKKVDGDDEKKTLSGAVFQLLDENNNVVSISAVTGKDGKVEFNNLKYGVKYTIKEMIPPLGYDKSDYIQEVILKDTTFEKVVEVIFKNYKEEPVFPPIIPEDNGKIIIKKVDSDNENKVLSGAKFGLYDENDKLLDISLSTGQNGITEFTELKYGVKYKVKELLSPSGYIRSDEVYEFVLTDKNVIEYTYKNYKEPDKLVPSVPDKETPPSKGKIPGMLPQTGSLFDTKVLIILGVGIILLGTILLFKSRKELN